MKTLRFNIDGQEHLVVALDKGDTLEMEQSQPHGLYLFRRNGKAFIVARKYIYTQNLADGEGAFDFNSDDLIKDHAALDPGLVLGPPIAKRQMD